MNRKIINEQVSSCKNQKLGKDDFTRKSKEYMYFVKVNMNKKV